jgi:glycosyltransferase involved in cell wall biosynthesis
VDMARDLARRLTPRLAPGFDVIVTPAGITEIALLRTDIPIVYAHDATFDLLNDYYPRFTGLLASNVREGHLLERMAVSRAALLTYPSEWAARSAREVYGAPAERVHVISWGANLDGAPRRARATRPRPRDACSLLFVGMDWERKGGPVALDALRALRRRGVNARLTVVGCRPPEVEGEAGVRVIPRLDKGGWWGRIRLARLYLDAHFLLLPTRADCTPVVLAEASAHGVPSLAADTGGLRGAVTEGENGYLLPPDADGEAYAALLEEIYRDPARHHALSCASRAAYEQRLNWDRWAGRMSALLDTFC